MIYIFVVPSQIGFRPYKINGGMVPEKRVFSVKLRP